MLQTPKEFADFMNRFGVSADDYVIVYGREGFHFLPRVWYTFHPLGHRAVSIMRGSLEEWIERGGPIDNSQVG
jgi:thiosulfate/3-mercaptopyruvate sulfurtransferase